MPRSSKLPVLILLTGQKSGFPPPGRLVAPIQVKLGSAVGHLSPRGCAKYLLYRHRGGMRRPKYQKYPLLAKSRRLAVANRLTDF